MPSLRKFVALVLLSLCALAAGAREVTYEGVRAQVIIDVRTPAEFAAGHVEGAVNIPFEGIGEGVAAIKGVGKDSNIVLYCQSGRRAGIAKATLEQAGYSRVVNGGGGRGNDGFHW